MILDFLMFVTYRFLTRMKRFSPKNIVLRTFNIVSVMIANIVLFLFSIIFMFLIKLKAINYGAPLVIALVCLLWLLVFIVVRRKYRKVFRKAMRERIGKYPFSEGKNTVLFFCCFFGSFIIIGCGVLFLRRLIYGIS